jgi:hypothetical protein
MLLCIAEAHWGKYQESGGTRYAAGAPRWPSADDGGCSLDAPSLLKLPSVRVVNRAATRCVFIFIFYKPIFGFMEHAPADARAAPPAAAPAHMDTTESVSPKRPREHAGARQVHQNAMPNAHFQHENVEWRLNALLLLISPQ